MKKILHPSFTFFITTLLILSTVTVRSQPQRTSAITNTVATTIDGFSPEASITQRKLEAQFRGVPTPDSAREHLRRLTAEPHVAGTPESYRVAVYIRDQLRAAGLSAELKEYQVLLPYPKQPSLVEVITPSRREPLSLQEAVVAEDATSKSARIVSLFNGYSASGDVTAPLVYVNYGLPNDYEALKKIGTDMRGKIVIARYGRSFRGVKAKVAEQNGAIGLIIYSDPADDGYAQGDVYPKGPWRSETSAQRGSVEYIFEYPGDPLTPNTPAVRGSTRLLVEQATNIPRIPVQPISYGDARRLLEPLGGPSRPRGFQGGLPFAYHVGGTNDVRVRLKIDMDYQVRSIHNVIARIDGSEEPDRWVILGNHHDAWTFGAVDPNSGTTAMLEVGRGLGTLLKQGWRPRRTMMICAWDGEEYGLIGSTEWVEENAAELREKAVAYLNMDSGVSGANFGAAAVPSLWKLVRAASRDISDPQTGKPVYETWQEHWRETQLEEGGARSRTAATATEATIGALGSGSDYTPFLQHLGIPALDISFNGDYGVYHSAYDSFHWMAKFGDPTFRYHVAAAQAWGTVALRLGNAAALPMNYMDYAGEIRNFVTAIEQAATERRLADAFDVKSLLSAVQELSEAAERLEARRSELILETERATRRGNSNTSAAAANLKRLNDGLIAAERALTDGRGLRGRSWYKHQIYAPGFYTGYAAQPLPDLRQAIDDRNPTAAHEAAVRITEALRRAAQVLSKARN